MQFNLIGTIFLLGFSVLHAYPPELEAILTTEVKEKLRAMKFAEKVTMLSLFPMRIHQEEIIIGGKKIVGTANHQKAAIIESFKKEAPGAEDFLILSEVFGYGTEKNVGEQGGSLKHLFSDEQFKVLHFDGKEEAQLRGMIEKMSDKIEEKIRSGMEGQKDPSRIIKKEKLKENDYANLRVLIFHVSYYKNVMDFLERFDMASADKIKKLYENVRMAVEKRIKELEKQQKGRTVQNKELMDQHRWAAEFNTDEAELQYLPKWLQRTIEKLRKKIGKIAHVWTHLEKAVQTLILDCLVWEPIPRGKKITAAGLKLGEYGLKLPAAEETEVEAAAASSSNS